MTIHTYASFPALWPNIYDKQLKADRIYFHLYFRGIWAHLLALLIVGSPWVRNHDGRSQWLRLLTSWWTGGRVREYREGRSQNQPQIHAISDSFPRPKLSGEDQLCRHPHTCPEAHITNLPNISHSIPFGTVKLKSQSMCACVCRFACVWVLRSERREKGNKKKEEK